MTTHQDMVYQMGGSPVGDGIPAWVSKVIWLDPTFGSDSNSGDQRDKAVATLPAAYAKLTAGKHEAVAYVPGASSLSLSAAFTWAKDYTHFLGMGAAPGVANRARIFQAATATGLSPLFNVTASGCLFRDFYIFQGVDDATSLINVQVTGGQNVFRNIHFAGGGHATQAVDGGASLKLNGAEENLFAHCTIGVDTIEAATGMTALQFDGSAARNRFEDCMIQLLAGNAGARLVELIDATALDRWTEFIRCRFIANSVNQATTIASAFEIPAGHTTTANILLLDTVGRGFTDWDDDNRGLIYLDRGAITAGGNSGILQASASV